MTKVKVGQKVRIGNTAKCIEALENFYLAKQDVTPALGRIATVIEITTFADLPAVRLKFRTRKTVESGDLIIGSYTYWPVSVLRKP